MKYITSLILFFILAGCTQQPTTQPTISTTTDQKTCTQGFCISLVSKEQLIGSGIQVPILSSDVDTNYDTYLIKDHNTNLHFYASAYTKPHLEQIIKTSDNKYVKTYTGVDGKQNISTQYIQIFERQYPELTLEEEINKRFIGDSDTCESTTNGSEIKLAYKSQYQQDAKTGNPIPSSGTGCNKEYINNEQYSYFGTIQSRSDIFYYVNKGQEGGRWSEIFDINDPICNKVSTTMGGLSVERNQCPTSTETNEYLSYGTGYQGWSGAMLDVINHTLDNSGTENLSLLAVRYPNQQATSQLLTLIKKSGCELTGEDLQYVQPNTLYQQQLDTIVQKVESQGQESLTNQEQVIYSNLLSPCFGDGGSYESLGSGLLWRRNMKNGGGARGAYITNISLN